MFARTKENSLVTNKITHRSKSGGWHRIGRFKDIDYNPLMRNFILALVLLIAVVFISWRLAEVEQIIKTLQQGDWRYIFLGLIAVFGWLFMAAGLYYFVYRALGLEDRILNLFFVASAALFMNIVAPSVGVSGMTVFLTEAKRRNLPPGRVTVAGALTLMFEYAGFMSILVLGFIVLFRRNHLNAGDLLAAGALLVLFSGFAFMIYLGVHSGEELGNALAGLAHKVNRILRPIVRREYLSEVRAREFAFEMSSGLRELKSSPRRLVGPAILGLAKQVILVVVLYLTFKAFNVPVSIGTLVAAFSISYLFLIVSPTPAGIGFVEGALTLSLTSMYVPLGTATVITLAYRGLTFWVPFFFGLYSFRHLGGERGMRPATQKEYTNLN